MFNKIADRAKWSVGFIALALATVAGSAQNSPGPIIAKFSPGQSVRYEFDGLVRISTDHAANVKVNGPADCDYRLRAVLKFDFGAAAKDGALGGSVHFEGAESSAPDCPDEERSRFSAAIHALEGSGTEFQIHPAGDVRLTRPVSAADPEVVNILLKSAWDLLQPRISDAPIAAESHWTASRRFLYWPDTFVENMEVAAASMQYTRNLTLGERSCALMKYKQIFSPTDMPAYVDARSRARDFTGTTYITGHAGVTLLLDRASHRIVYLHRERKISNRLVLKYESGQSSNPLATFAVDEESTLRWLPEPDAQAFLADLSQFESSASAPGAPTPAPEHSVAAIAAASKKQDGRDESELSTLLYRPPQGFQRWAKGFCSGPYCFNLSLAVPDGTREAQRSETTVLLLGGLGERAITIAVGPILDNQRSGLRADELLQQQTRRFVGNNLWFERGTGELISFSSETLDSRPAIFSDFTSTARDLTPVRGHLVIVVAPYGRLVPVACAYSAAQPGLDAVCQTVIESLVVH